MKLILRSLNGGLARRLSCVRCISTTITPGGGIENKSRNSLETEDAFQQRIFGGFTGNDQHTDSFYQKLDKAEKDHGRTGFGSNLFGSDGGVGGSQFMDTLDDSFLAVSEGMDGKLKKKARYFEFDSDEIASGDYAYRPDVTFQPGMTYETKELDLTKPAARRPFQQDEFQVTTEEVLRKADFRNVRFLANFLTDAGIIIKRSQTRISAKAQRKVAREIKTARAFGLMPFTTMGQDRFVFGKSRDEADMSDDDYQSPLRQHRFVADEPTLDPPQLGFVADGIH